MKTANTVLEMRRTHLKENLMRDRGGGRKVGTKSKSPSIGQYPNPHYQPQLSAVHYNRADTIL